MAEEIANIGEATGLQNLASVPRSSPITTGLRLAESDALRALQYKEKKDKDLADAEKFIRNSFYKTGSGKLKHPELSKVVSEDQIKTYARALEGFKSGNRDYFQELEGLKQRGFDVELADKNIEAVNKSKYIDPKAKNLINEILLAQHGVGKRKPEAVQADIDIYNDENFKNPIEPKGDLFLGVDEVKPVKLQSNIAYFMNQLVASADPVTTKDKSGKVTSKKMVTDAMLSEMVVPFINMTEGQRDYIEDLPEVKSMAKTQIEKETIEKGRPLLPDEKFDILEDAATKYTKDLMVKFGTKTNQYYSGKTDVSFSPTSGGGFAYGKWTFGAPDTQGWRNIQTEGTSSQTAQEIRDVEGNITNAAPVRFKSLDKNRNELEVAIPLGLGQEMKEVRIIDDAQLASIFFDNKIDVVNKIKPKKSVSSQKSKGKKLY